MPMLDVQRRHAEVFRIRLGEKGPKGEPRKLTDALRVTSPSRRVVDAFVEAYGGEAQSWDAPSGPEWEAKLPITELSIMVLPGNSCTQWWELYRGSVCERRCDGFTETLSGKACLCPSEITDRMEAKAGTVCRPTTRINVACPDVNVVGAGAVVTHGLIAAETLPQSIAIAEAALARGLMVPAVLRVVEHKGKRHFVVPQIEITGLNLSALATGEIRTTPRAVEPSPHPAIAAAPPPQPPPAPPAGLPPLPHEIDDAFDLGPLRTELASYDEEIRAAVADGWKWGSIKPGATNRIATKADAEAALDYAMSVAAQIYDRRRKRAMAKFTEAGLTGVEKRHRLVTDATKGATHSTKRLTADQLAAVLDAIAARKEASA